MLRFDLITSLFVLFGQSQASIILKDVGNECSYEKKGRKTASNLSESTISMILIISM